MAVVALAGAIVYLWRYYAGRLKEIDVERLAWADERGKLHEEIRTLKENKGERMDAERLQWTKERTELENDLEASKERIRADFEALRAAAAIDFARQLREQSDQARAHEDQVRKEFTDAMEVVSTQIDASTAKVAAVLDKIYDRFIDPSKRRRGS